MINIRNFFISFFISLVFFALIAWLIFDKVIHAGGGEIDVEITETDINVILEDHGPGIENIELAMKEGYSTAPDNIRSLGFGAGMGLPNIKKYTDDFQIDTKVGVGTKLTLKVNI